MKTNKKEYDECPCCDNWSIAVINGRVVRHESGLGYVPYRLYHAFAKHYPNDESMSVKNQAKRQLCPASGKTIKEARKIQRKRKLVK